MGECFVQMDIGSELEDHLALQNLQFPVGSTNRTVQNGSSLAGFLLSKDLLLVVLVELAAQIY